jgi:hypothetical protein
MIPPGKTSGRPDFISGKNEIVWKRSSIKRIKIVIRPIPALTGAALCLRNLMSSQPVNTTTKD